MGYASATETGYHGVCWCYMATMRCAGATETATMGYAGATETGYHRVC